jgi:DNA-binding transcriptional ArsR family regulator/anti-sigma regulatory factor (Ser/Thr protein kinase)
LTIGLSLLTAMGANVDNQLMAIRDSSERIRSFILKNTHRKGLAKHVADRFDISRQAVHEHLKALVQQGLLVAEGKIRTQSYKLATTASVEFRYSLSDGLAEDEVWRRDIAPFLRGMPDNVLSIWNYAFTEMFNNAIDHSSGSTIFVTIAKSAIDTEMSVTDNGVGIFRKIQTAFDLPDEKQAIFELSKGKLTTDVVNHSGQGIFFTSRMVNAFDILSGGTYFSHEMGSETDWMMDMDSPAGGTTVLLRVDNNTARTIRKVYDQYSVEGTFGFNKTTIPVRLAKYGSDQLVSRSQAKRVLMRVEQFSRVVFDFTGIDLIGQAFADQIFRVFALEHPSVDLVTIHANPQIQGLINAVIKTGRPGYKGTLPLFEK